MRKLTILGLSLLLSVGAFAQAQLPSAKAQKLSASAMKAEQTFSLQSKYPNVKRSRTAAASTSGFVEQFTSTSRALVSKPARSKSKAPVTSDNIYAGMQYPASLIGGGKINPTTGVFTKIFSTAGAPQSLGVNPDKNEIYTIEWRQGQTGYGNIAYHIFDATTGAAKKEVLITSQEQFNFTPLYAAYVLDDNAFYGYANEGWVKLDCNTLEPTVVAADATNPRSEGLYPYGLTYNSNTEEIVALVESSSSVGIIKINKATGAYGAVTPVSVTSQYIGGFAYDSSSDSYLFNPNDDSVSEIVAIDASTLAVTTVCEIPGAPQTAGIYVNEVKPKDPLAPLAPEFGSATFTDGSLSGTVTFTLPTQNAGKEDLTGNLTYTIKAGDEVIASDTAAPGAQVSASYTATASGEVTFTCIASQDTHVSKGAAKTIYIGIDTPAAPANVTLSPTTVTWDAVTTGIHDGYIDLSKITYTVSINNQVVADGIKDTSCRTNLPVNAELKNYVAKVTATADGLTGPAASSNDIAFGQPLNEPVSLAPTAQQAKLFTLINNNDDTKSGLTMSQKKRSGFSTARIWHRTTISFCLRY